MANRRSLAAAVTVVALAAFGIHFPSDAAAAIRLIVALPLVLFCPGYALMAALFPPAALSEVGGHSPQIDRSERLLLSVALSMVTAAIGGLILDQIGGGLWAGSWAVLLTGVTLAAAIPALVRSRHLLSTLRPPAVRISWGRLLAYAAALTLAVAAIVVARTSAVNSQGKPFTQLWILPNSSATTAQVGIRSQEVAQQRYVLRIVSDGQVANTYSLSLAPGQTWQRTVSMVRIRRAVAAYLYRSTPGGAPYRWVKLDLSGVG